MKEYFEEIIKLAEKAYKSDNVPVGAIVVKDGKIIGKGYNQKIKTNKVIDHAEILAIINAAKNQGDWRLDECELYVSLEPCNMCKEVIKQSRIKKVYYLAKSTFYNENGHPTEYIDGNTKFHELKEKYLQKLQDFFAEKR